MEQNRLRELEEQCIQNCPPPCTSICPLHVDIRQIVQSIRSGDYTTAYKTYKKSVPFPEIIARICDQPCQQQCHRNSQGGSIQVARLELFCVKNHQETAQKITILPARKSTVAILGSGLSSMTAAFDLGRKGYQVTLFTGNEPLGGYLWDIPDSKLPRDVLQSEVKQIEQAGVTVNQVTFSGLGNYESEFDAVFLGLDSQAAGLVDNQTIDPITFQVQTSKVFCGGRRLPDPSPVYCISDGRRAAISIDRFLQNVSLTASRQNEGTYATRLITNTSAVKENMVVEPANAVDGFTRTEAEREAERCLLCDCMECVKVCEYLKQYGSYPKKYVREIYNNLSIIMRARTSNKFINSCTLCGLCKEVCPTDLDMGQVNKETRQVMVKTNHMPPSAHDFALRDMAFSNSEKFSGVFLPGEGTSCKYLFFPGCQLAASNPEYTGKIYQDLTKVLPYLGVMLGCCGAPADWSGEEKIFSEVIAALRDRWEQMGKPTLVLACSSCNQVLKKNLEGARILSVWEVFEEKGIFPSRPSTEKQYTIHDPCTSRYEKPWQDAVRQGLSQMGIKHHELKMSRQLTECCGYGGVAWLANPELVKDMIQRRINEDESDYLTYCVMCRDLFSSQGKPTLHLLDLVYGSNLDELSRRKSPDYSQRHENRMRTRQSIARLFHRKELAEVEPYEKINLILSQTVRELMESRLILVEDVQKVIHFAETSGARFINQKTGHTLAYYKPNIITYWVEYNKVDNGYGVYDAYSHRMDFEGDSSL